jgi:hypothetical protein
MGKLVTVSQYAEMTFEEASRPKHRTMLSWIESGDLNAVKIGRAYYIDPDDAVGTSQNLSKASTDQALRAHYDMKVATAINSARRKLNETTRN